MKERRMYSRIVLNIDTIIYLSNGQELICTIYDISENGICLILKKDIETPDIKIGDIVTFQSVDKFVLYNKEISEFISGQAKILRIQKANNKISIGCKFTYIPKSLCKYIQDKKISIFIKNGYQIH